MRRKFRCSGCLVICVLEHNMEKISVTLKKFIVRYNMKKLFFVLTALVLTGRVLFAQTFKLETFIDAKDG